MKKDDIRNYAQALIECTKHSDDAVVRSATEKFVAYVRDKGYSKHLPEILERYTMLYNEQHGIKTAYVTTARPLVQTERNLVIDTILKKIPETRVELHELVDETVIGGMKIKIGDRVYDGSIRNTLARLQATLTK